MQDGNSMLTGQISSDKEGDHKLAKDVRFALALLFVFPVSLQEWLFPWPHQHIWGSKHLIPTRHKRAVQWLEEA